MGSILMSDPKELLLRFEGMWIMKLERWKQAVDGPLSGRVRLIVEGQEVILEAGYPAWHRPLRGSCR